VDIAHDVYIAHDVDVVYGVDVACNNLVRDPNSGRGIFVEGRVFC
jgi:hypothetical protein